MNLSKTKLIYIYISVVFLIYTGNISAQKWTYSNQLKSTVSVTPNSSLILPSKDFFSIGVFTGTLTIGDLNYTAINQDIFLTKYNALSTPIWTKHISGAGLKIYPRITSDKANNIYVSGQFATVCKFSNTDSLISTGAGDVFLAKYNVAGDLLWRKHIATNPAIQFNRAIATDNSNNVIMSIGYKDSITINMVTYKSAIAGKNNNVIAKLDSAGAFIWVKNYACTDNLEFRSIDVFDNEYYLNGLFKGDLTLDLKTLTGSSTTFNMVIYKTDSMGVGKWVRRAYSDAIDAPSNIVSDNYGSVYLTGSFQSAALQIDSTDSEKSPKTLSRAGYNDMFIYKFNKNGQLQWSRSYGSKGTDYGIEAKLKNDILYIAGYFSDTLVFGNDTLRTTNITTDNDIFIGSLNIQGDPLRAFSIPTGGNKKHDLSWSLSVSDLNDVIVSADFKSDSIFVNDSAYKNTGTISNGLIAKFEPSFVATFTQKKNVSCKNGKDGSLSVLPYFGVLPYTYKWSHLGVTDTIAKADSLTANTYTVTVVDAIGSTVIITTSLSEPNVLDVNGTVSNTSCNLDQDGSIISSVTGGAMPYNYYWAGTGTGVSVNAVNQLALTAGNYTVTIVDNNSCVASKSFTISQPNKITFEQSVVTNAINLGKGDIVLNPTGGNGLPDAWGYSWTGPSFTSSQKDINNLLIGTYTVTATDTKNCKGDTTFTIIDEFILNAAVSSTKNVSCKGGDDGKAKITVNNAQGELSYEWFNSTYNEIGENADSISNLEAGNYTVSVTDLSNNATAYTTVTITEPTMAVSADSTTTTSVKCYNQASGAANVIPKGGTLPYTYKWSNDSISQGIVLALSGTYAVTVTDGNGCTASKSDITIANKTDIAITITKQSAISCFGENKGELLANATGGTPSYSYLWSDPAHQNTPLADKLTNGNYTVTVTDGNGCKKEDFAILKQPTLLTSTAKIKSVKCFDILTDGEISVKPSGGTVPYLYTWSNGKSDSLIAGLSNGEYYVTITDQNNCLHLDTFTVGIPDTIKINSITINNNAICYGEAMGSINAIATGGQGVYQYSISPSLADTNATGLFENLPKGNYTIAVTDSNNCGPIFSNNLEITTPDSIIINITAINDTLTCWNDNDGSISLDAVGGTGIKTIKLLTMDAQAIDSNTTGNFTSLSAGKYLIEATDASNCYAKGDTFDIFAPKRITFDSIIIKKPTTLTGNNGSIETFVSGGVGTISYQLQPLNVSNTNGIFTGLEVGQYTIKAEDNNLCYADSLVEMEANSIISIDGNGNIKIFPNPITDVLNIELFDNLNSYKIELYDMSGKIVYQNNINGAENKTLQIPTARFASGSYTLRISDNNTTNSIVIIKR